MPCLSEEPCDPGEEFDHLFQFPEDEDVDFAWKITRFEPTPVMSTYLVAYANGEFRHLESAFYSPLSGRTVPLRIYSKHQWRHSSISVQEGNSAATPRNLPHAGFALEVTARVLPLYEQIFDIEYPLPKLDTLVVSGFFFRLISFADKMASRSTILMFVRFTHRLTLNA
jgi:aminopeptidase 2